MNKNNNLKKIEYAARLKEIQNQIKILEEREEKLKISLRDILDDREKVHFDLPDGHYILEKLMIKRVKLSGIDYDEIETIRIIKT